jgi:CheY-like chemotaxis protein
LRLVIVSDISERLKFEQEREQLLVSERIARAEAERANRLNDEFLATLSHELRTPLNSIVGWSQLLRMGHLKPEEAEQGLDSIERNAMAQAQMISDLLDVSRITSGKIRLEVQTLDPAELIEGALTTIALAADAKAIRLTKSLDPHAGLISGDPTRLQQIVWNLVNNAVKFTPKEGRIHVTLGRIDAHIEIRVSDTGSGIAESQLQTIFERFSQEDASSSREHGGLGLGLAIAKQLAEMHGGTIAAESPGKGQGATFIIKLPILSAPSLKPDSGDTPDASSESARSIESRAKLAAARLNVALPAIDLSGVRVLVVEDDADSRFLLKRIITAMGASTAETASAAEALDALEAFDPHVLISDLGMPGRDGFHLIRDVRGRGYSFQKLPAVALTAFARTEDRRRALLAGFQVHLSKPVDPWELGAVIASLVGRTDQK